MTSKSHNDPSSEHLVLLYHFFHPDDVISARLFSDVARRFSDEGWQVTAMPAARWFESNQPLPKHETWGKVLIKRVWRPAFKQSSNVGRILNAATMLCQWSWRAVILRRQQRETVIIGTDPILSVLVAIPWRIFRPRAKIVHWCHDLHPEATFADGVLRENAWYVKLLRRLIAAAYRRCNLIIDLGACMRGRLKSACGLPASQDQRYHTVTPWALVEPEHIPVPDPQTREDLFGHVSLACLYSGNLGRAHEFTLFLELAAATQQDSIRFCFAGRGPRLAEVRQRVEGASLHNVSFADFAAEDVLEKRLAAGDVHLVSLRENWTGTVVPSKFFGALAIGRPILFVGSPECAIAQWINQHQVGWHLRHDNIEAVSSSIRTLAEDPIAKQTLNEHCQSVYRRFFSQDIQLDKLAKLIRETA